MAKISKKAKRMEKRLGFQKKIEKVAKERTRGGGVGVGGSAIRNHAKANIFSTRKRHSVLLLGTGAASVGGSKGSKAKKVVGGEGDASGMLESLLELEDAMDEEAMPASSGRDKGRGRMQKDDDWSSDEEDVPEGAAALRQAPATSVRATAAQQREALSLAAAVKEHPAYRQNPFAALRQHVANFVALEEEESQRATQQAVRQARAISKSDRARDRARQAQQQAAAAARGGAAGRR
jgi:hypothetical protein